MMLVMCGVPGSGKSTIARRLSRMIPGGVMHVETDKIRSMFSYPTYTKQESELVYAVMFSAAAAALARKYTVILDATFPRRAYRNQAIRIARAMGTSCHVIYVKCSNREALKRNKFRKATSRVPPRVINRMATNFEPPRNAVQIDSRYLSPARSAELILSSLKADKAFNNRSEISGSR
jgi:predicted kinase